MQIFQFTAHMHTGQISPVQVWDSSFQLYEISKTLLVVAQEPMGDILVFLTGQDDIDAAVKLLIEEVQNRGKNSLG